MPKGDGTGPLGKGPVTGRGKGPGQGKGKGKKSGNRNLQKRSGKKPIKDKQ